MRSRTAFPLALTLALTLALAACGPGGPPAGPPQLPAATGSAASVALPPMRTFPPSRGAPSTRANAAIAQDFLDLSFRLESGRELAGFSRFTGPMTLRLTGAVPPTAPAEVAALLGRLRAEAGLDIAMAPAGAPAALTVEFLPRARMQARARDAACFVAPNVSSWRDYRRASAARLDWTSLTERTEAAIFIPSDTSPQEIRDCLHEELAQALGPLNDLYRLPDSVFNDDNIHGVLTGFDMVILRATYDPALQPGMPQGAVAAALPAVLARVNPGGNVSGAAAPPTPRAFGEAISRALGPGPASAGRTAAAREALAIAEPWQDVRTGFAWLTLGRVAGPDGAELALAAFANAAAVYQANGLPLHAAHAELQLAMFALAAGDWAQALALTDRAIPAARAAQNASLLSSLMMVKAAALDRLGRATEAASVRLDSLGWARYGMADDDEVRRRLSFIDALASQGAG